MRLREVTPMHQIDDFSITIDTSDGAGKVQKAQYSTREFVLHILRSGRQFNSDYAGIRLGGRIEDACRLKRSGPIVLDSSDWEILCEACKAPVPIAGMPPYPLSPASKCVALIDRVLEAKAVTPEARRPKRRR